MHPLDRKSKHRGSIHERKIILVPCNKKNKFNNLNRVEFYKLNLQDRFYDDYV